MSPDGTDMVGACGLDFGIEREGWSDSGEEDSLGGWVGFLSSGMDRDGDSTLGFNLGTLPTTVLLLLDWAPGNANVGENRSNRSNRSN